MSTAGTVNTEEVHNGAATAGQIFKFAIADTGMVVVSNQALDATVYSCELLALRRTFTNADADYVPMMPSLVLDNDNNYQILATGDYAVRVTTSADIIVAVTQ